MHILQSGLPKSGNFWLWQILQQILIEAELQHESFIQAQPIYPIAKTWNLSFAEQAGIDTIDILPNIQYYRISSIFRMPIDDFDAYLSQTNHVWTHSDFNAGSKEIFPKFDKIIYIVRDPRDVILSQNRFAFTEYRQQYLPTVFDDTNELLDVQIARMSKRWRKQVALHLLNREAFNIHILFYETLLRDFDREIAKLLNYLGVQLSEAQLDRIKQAVQFDTMKHQNPEHVNRGQAYKWVDQLSDSQQLEVRKRTGKLLELLDYPLSSRDTPSLPSIENLQRRDLVQEIKNPFFQRILQRSRRFFS